MTALKPSMFSKRSGALVAALGVFFLTQFAVEAQAAGAVPVSTPSGKWAVGPVFAGAGSDPATGYCSMKTSYSNGQMIVFARDQKGVNSLAIDFKKNKLDAGRQYGVVLAVPPYVMRQTTAVAATSHVLIMQMGRDPAFYDALRRNDQMVVMLPALGDKFSYGLSGTMAALGDLDGCVKEMNPHYQGELDVMTVSEMRALPPMALPDVEPAAGNPDLQISVDSPQPDDSVDVELIKAENKALTLENAAMAAKLDAQGKKLEAERVQSQARLQKNQDEINALKSGMEKTNIQDAQVTGRIAALEAENGRLKAQIASQPKSIVATTPTTGTTAHNCVAVATMGAGGVKNAVMSLASSADPLMDLIVAARVASGSGIVSEKGFSSAGGEGYAWQSDAVYGGAQRVLWQDGQDFDGMIDGYLSTAKERCPGDFAVSRGGIESTEGKQFETAEIACIGGPVQSAAALLFLGDGKVLTVVSHEGDPERMATTLAKRDAVLEKARTTTGRPG